MAESHYVTVAADGTPAASVLEEAHDIVHGPRRLTYGHPKVNHQTTADLMSAFLARKYGLAIALDAEDVCWFNVLQKVARQAHAPKRDNLVDIAGYVANIELISQPDVDQADVDAVCGAGLPEQLNLDDLLPRCEDCRDCADPSYCHDMRYPLLRAARMDRDGQ